MNITTWVAVLFSVEVAGVFALEYFAKRPARRGRRAGLVVEDDDGRTRVSYLSSGLMNLNVSPAIRPADSSATR